MNHGPVSAIVRERSIPVVVPPATAPPRMVRVASVRQETRLHSTIVFPDPMAAAGRAGTFVMVWLPGLDEIPMAVGPKTSDGLATITVAAAGDGSSALVGAQAGDLIGVRGPFGRPFDWGGSRRVLLVGGGIGLVPLLVGAQELRARGAEVVVANGARSADLLVFQGRFAEVGAVERESTDDGSRGTAGFVTQLAEKILDEHPGGFDLIATCGPERMMARVVELGAKRKVPVAVSLERYMKCAVGICDACVVGEGIRLCREGPCFGPSELGLLAPDFGRRHRDASGLAHPV